MSFSVTLSPPSLSLFPRTQQPRVFRSLTSVRFETRRLFRASRRNSNFPQGNDNLVDDPRNWSRSISSDFVRRDDDHDEDDDDDGDADEEDRSLDLLVKFVQNVFKKVSRRARRAVRSVLPVAIPTKLVRFSVNGVLILAFLWVLKAFLEVVCTLGSVVFVSILLIRGIWTGVAYLKKETQNLKINEFEDENRAWNSAQPAS